MEDNLEEYAANFSAVINSEKIPDRQKKMLLGNMIRDLEFVFREEFESSNCKQKKEKILKIINDMKNKLIEL